jgi:very-short-patch-repair endonuclease
MTDAETALWRLLRDRRLAGHKFRRQHPIGRYVADFCCFDQMLVVELDGGQHMENQRDAERDFTLRSEGYRVLRFWNDQILKERDVVLDEIWRVLHEAPSP